VRLAHPRSYQHRTALHGHSGLRALQFMQPSASRRCESEARGAGRRTQYSCAPRVRVDREALVLVWYVRAWNGDAGVTNHGRAGCHTGRHTSSAVGSLVMVRVLAVRRVAVAVVHEQGVSPRSRGGGVCWPLRLSGVIDARAQQLVAPAGQGAGSSSSRFVNCVGTCSRAAGCRAVWAQWGRRV